jgi:hypothetical protein
MWILGSGFWDFAASGRGVERRPPTLATGTGVSTLASAGLRCFPFRVRDAGYS